MTASLYFDGTLSSKRAQGGWAAVVFAAAPVVASGQSRPLDKGEPRSAQVVELLGLEAGLDWVLGVRGLTRLKVRGDNKHVLEAVRGGLKFKGGPASQKANSLVAQVKARLDALKLPVDLAWTPREMNRAAHRAAAGGELGGCESGSHDDRVRELAHSLWEGAGRPPGSDLHFWLEAEERLARSLLENV